MYGTAATGVRQPRERNFARLRRLLRLLRRRLRGLRLGARRGGAGRADAELVDGGVVELTGRRQTLLRLVITDGRRRARPHPAVDRAGIEALVTQRLLGGADVGLLVLGGGLLHRVDSLVLRLDRLLLDLVHGGLGLRLRLVLGAFRLILDLVGRRWRRGLGGGRAQDPDGADHHCDDTRE